MFKTLKDYIQRNQEIMSLIRPFLLRKHKDVISVNNKIVDAYIYDWDDIISNKNQLIEAFFKLGILQEGEEDEEDNIR
ncbi:MAG: hypothetical protein GXP60_05000 [Epsilonproteobacteria bacterium]|nr:hypothetical protein [Campylobacterota bacterium]